MSEVKGTELRHRMLSAVAKDRDFSYDPPLRSKPGAFGHRGGFLESNEKRALSELLRLGLIVTVKNPDWSLGEDVDLTTAGESVLGDWNIEWGEPVE